MKLRQLWEHKGKKLHCLSDFPPQNHHVSLATGRVNLPSWQGSRTKCSLSNTWAWSTFYSFRKGKQHISILTQWTLLLQSCLINYRSYKCMENTLGQISKKKTKQMQLLVLSVLSLNVQTAFYTQSLKVLKLCFKKNYLSQKNSK